MYVSLYTLTIRIRFNMFRRECLYIHTLKYKSNLSRLSSLSSRQRHPQPSWLFAIRFFRLWFQGFEFLMSFFDRTKYSKPFEENRRKVFIFLFWSLISLIFLILPLVYIFNGNIRKHGNNRYQIFDEMLAFSSLHCP